ncbi:hypothetical protein K438DRAFT_1767330 [Mycena galopus ATCC 62051]|nr:hypothetical protein K438DRAFT_1767330 [Mycena galopus ATCC 62051]
MSLFRFGAQAIKTVDSINVRRARERQAGGDSPARAKEGGEDKGGKKSPAAADVCRPVWTRVGKSVQMPNLPQRKAKILASLKANKGDASSGFHCSYGIPLLGNGSSHPPVPSNADQSVATPRLLPDPVMRKLLDPQNHDRLKEDVSDARSAIIVVSPARSVVRLPAAVLDNRRR